jgi:predicted O-methyltransferase YrrM
MMDEFETVWPFLKKGGVILADDVYLNDALLDFASQKGRGFVILSGAHKRGFHLGGMRK